ncbi:hypothetical protein E8E14_000323 [Neopestalotiopsis sp. 37M]|nr:hypothetical protein E8E14_000323 [Neopestalotiopsis sp. 37M]
MANQTSSPESWISEFVEAANSGKMEAIRKFFASNLRWSDYGWGKIDMDREAVCDFFEETFRTTKDLSMTTREINTNPQFTAWEWELSFEPFTDDETRGLQVGQKITRKYVSLFHWTLEDGMWKISKAAEYSGC